MAGFIVLDDGRAYAAARWAFRATVAAVCEAIPETNEGKALTEWLTNDPSVQIYYNVDVRELTPTNRVMFLAAVETAFQAKKAQGPVDWAEPEFWDGWIARFGDLVKMIECVRRGEPAAEFNSHMSDIIPATGERSGPGW